MKDQYRETLKALEQELDTLQAEQEQLFEQRELIADQLVEKAKRIKSVEETIASFQRLCGIQPTRRVRFSTDLARFGLTEAVRAVMKKATDWMTAIDVRKQMLENGFDDGKYDNLLASVHVTLKRLANTDELLRKEVEGKTAYKVNPDYVPRIMGLGEPGLGAYSSLRMQKDKK